jgi:hypothetical protein
MICPECNSPNNTEYGFYYKRKPTLAKFQQYRCKDCKRVFHDAIPLSDALNTEVVGKVPDQSPLSIAIQVNTQRQNDIPSQGEPPKPECQ